jgi:hypothetical protein
LKPSRTFAHFDPSLRNDE